MWFTKWNVSSQLRTLPRSGVEVEGGKHETTPAILADGVGSHAPPASVKVQLHGSFRTQVHINQASMQSTDIVALALARSSP